MFKFIFCYQPDIPANSMHFYFSKSSHFFILYNFRALAHLTYTFPLLKLLHAPLLFQLFLHLLSYFAFFCFFNSTRKE